MMPTYLKTLEKSIIFLKNPKLIIVEPVSATAVAPKIDNYGLSINEYFPIMPNPNIREAPSPRHPFDFEPIPSRFLRFCQIAPRPDLLPARKRYIHE